jgi:4'-phosphopantetheinyl transferase
VKTPWCKALRELPPVAVAETLSGRPGVVDLFCFFYDEDAETAPFESYFSLMTDEERARHDRYYFARDRRLFLATRALVRTVLSRYVAASPTSWQFATGERGKPYIVGPASTAEPRLHFNLSNTHGLVVCAVSVAHSELGVDAEGLDRGGETVNIADHYFSPREVKALHALPSDEQRLRFFTYWTLKESYIKARGLGLALPLDQFSFVLTERAEIGIAFTPPLVDDPRVWRFALLDAPPRHLVAVGVCTDGAPLSLRATRVIPLRDDPAPGAP